ncbi:MAG TPA: ribulokinase [Spirochaetia bacterium]|nr:ribulokinase [Spirochaetia bacterium]
MENYILGVDFGTDSVRTVVINGTSGREESHAVSYYRRWSEGLYCDPVKYRFRQHPLDYIEALDESIRTALKSLGKGSGRQVAGIGIDTTGSTPCVVDREGTPLALKDEFSENPNAMFVIWKDHTAVREAEEINAKARSWGGTDFTRYEGGIYSSEWFWAKLLHILRADERVCRAAFSFVEHCDWMPALLTGNTDPLTMKRSRCAAGHKAMWHASWKGLPDEAFLVHLDPLLKSWRRNLFTETFTSDTRAGDLTREWAERMGLEPGTPVAVGAFDAHMGAVGGGVAAGALTKIMGTSTCDMTVAPYDVTGEKRVAGICGQVDGSIIPGMIGYEAGQSAFGDVFAWFADLLAWPLESVQTEEAREGASLRSKRPRRSKQSQQLRQEIRKGILDELNRRAEEIPPEETGLLALDWLNGRRTPDADQSLKGAIIGLTLGSSAPRVYRALVEATAFGSRATMERFIREGIEIREVIAIGGISQKSPFVMQVTCDAMNTPIKVAASEQATALGAAMFGAVAAGIYANVEEARGAMGSGFARTFVPDPARAAMYDRLYKRYLRLGKILEPELRSLGSG